MTATASATYDGYLGAVLAGQVKTNDVPKVSQLFTQIQAGCALAAVADQAGTNAIAPAELTVEVSQLVALVATLKTPTPPTP